MDWFISALAFIPLTAFLLAVATVPSVLIQRRGRPTAALAWLLVLFLVPIVGIFLWWAMGRRHLSRKTRKRRLATTARSERLTVLRDELPTPDTARWDIFPLQRLPQSEAEWVYAPTAGNSVRLLVDAAQAYPAMEQAIESAQRFIHVLFYIWDNDAVGEHFRDLLVHKARDGIEVRVLFDAIGGSRVRGKFMKPLRDAGAKVAAFKPPVILRRSLEINFRNHRKLLVVDGRIAILGGLNIGDEYTGDWRDAAVSLSGPVVDAAEDVFADDWFFATRDEFTQPSYFGAWARAPQLVLDHEAVCGIVASGPHTRFNLMHEAFLIAIHGAQSRIWLATPYFVPDQTISAALRSAAFRGLDVRLIVPYHSDNLLATLATRSYFADIDRSRCQSVSA